MSGPIGHTFIYNLIIIFIVIVFGFLAGTMSYYKAFKINNRIVSAIEKFEGYNSNDSKGGSKEEIDKVLRTFGYSMEKPDCPSDYSKIGDKQKMEFVEGSDNAGFKYCIYIDDTTPDNGSYYTYGVLTFMNIDLPIIRRINIPVFTKTNRIYKFSESYF